ncbi:MAG TPA: dephospho-CoA kinase [Yinghuangia sp.]|uniref:dephospho-CoA kinase n=1 Tax=Yinghuangia sp. YIM S10712 TaxID=3436930 RepID=UPI002B90968F|nr:dephospho-CoA kinase [Yinghuangia sp.]
MVNVGLTGGIGSGKSEVSKRLAAYGAVVIDSDLIAREVVEPGTPGLAAVVAEFGEDVLAADGTLDRPKLGALVFSDRERLAALNAIVHPLVGARAAELAASAAGSGAVLVNDVPLLAETKAKTAYDLVVVVDTSPETQVDRLVRLRGMTEQDARARMAAQATREERLAIADVVIDNDGPIEALEPQVRALWKRLTGEEPAAGA